MIRILLILIILGTPCFVAAETVNSVYVDGKAPIVIDGDLSDWEGIKTEHIKIPVRLYKFGITNVPNPPENDADLSANFQCLADAYYIYIAVIVNDDIPVFGEEMFGRSHDDDAIEFYFDGDLQNTSKMEYDENDLQILVTSDKNGKTLINGRAPLVLQLYPYMWEALGVKAELKRIKNGYVVEVAVPIKLLGWNAIETGKRMGMNIRVYDDDDGKRLDSVLEWADDPNSTSPISTQCFNQVVFQEKISSDVITTVQEQKSTNNVAKEIAVSVGAPDESNYEILFGTLRDIKNQDFEAAQAKLIPVQDRIWAMAMLALSQLGISNASMHPVIINENSDPGITTLQQIADRAPDAYVVVWAKEWLARAYRDKSDYENAIRFYEELTSRPFDIYVRNAKTELGLLYCKVNNKTQAINLFKEEIAEFDIKGYDDPYFMKNAILNTENFDLALELQEKIINSNAENGVKQKAKVEIAKIHFIKGDYDRSKQLAEEIINSNVDSNIALDAKLILYSIQKKMEK